MSTVQQAQPSPLYQDALQSDLRMMSSCALSEGVEKNHEEALLDINPELSITSGGKHCDKVQMLEMETGQLSDKQLIPIDIFQKFPGKGTAVRTMLTSGDAGADGDMTTVQQLQPSQPYQIALQSDLQRMFNCAQGQAAEKHHVDLLFDIDLDLFITGRRKHCDEVQKPEMEKGLSDKDIFQQFSGKGTAARTVLTTGDAGAGKSSLVQRVLLDWAEKRAHQDFHLIFPFDARKFNLWREERFSLAELIHACIPEIPGSGIKEETLNDIFTMLQKSRDKSEFKLLFVFDGLDPSFLPFNFMDKTEKSVDVTKQVRTELLLVNLIKGKLLPSAHIWITTQPAAAAWIPPQCVDMVTEIRGFMDPRDYFRKRFRDEEKVSRIISHINMSQSLNIMCHVPLFCSITATVLEDMLKTGEGGELPKSLTKIFAKFLMLQIKEVKKKYEPEQCVQCIQSLAKFAFQQLLRKNTMFNKAKLKCSGLSITVASKYSSLFSQIFEQVCGQRTGEPQKTMFCFSHLSFHEFMAAIHVHISLFNYNRNVMSAPRLTICSLLMCSSKPSVTYVYKTAVKMALQSENGDLDFFLRFLLGLSLQTNHTILQGMLTQTENRSWSKQYIVQYIKNKIRKNVSEEKHITLLLCLNELCDHSLVEEIQQFLSSRSLSIGKLSTVRWSALVSILLSSKEDLDPFDLRKYSASEEALLMLLPVVKASSKAMMSYCGLSLRGCKALSSVLSSQSSSLTELDLSSNDLRDSGVQQLSEGLRNPCCKLETLRLSGCMVTETGCASLASALTSNPSHLRELDLSYNHPGDSGVKLLSTGLQNPHWMLNTLRLDHIGEERLKPGMRKYACELELLLNTANQLLKLSHRNRKVTSSVCQPYPDHPERFSSWTQVLCRNALTGRCYWEVEWTGLVDISVSYRGIRRKGCGTESKFGGNNQSWTLSCFLNRYAVCHDNKWKERHFPSSVSNRIAVYVDCPAGILSFYSVSSDTLIHLYTFNAMFTEPLYAGFGCDSRLGMNLLNIESTVSLCQL
ncbi:NACHT, LRR and PYD domains-containing protein 3-like [Pholidichthys leucotaenia]